MRVTGLRQQINGTLVLFFLRCLLYAGEVPREPRTFIGQSPDRSLLKTKATTWARTILFLSLSLSLPLSAQTVVPVSMIQSGAQTAGTRITFAQAFKLCQFNQIAAQAMAQQALPPDLAHMPDTGGTGPGITVYFVVSSIPAEGGQLWFTVTPDIKWPVGKVCTALVQPKTVDTTWAAVTAGVLPLFTDGRINKIAVRYRLSDGGYSPSDDPLPPVGALGGPVVMFTFGTGGVEYTLVGWNE